MNVSIGERWEGFVEDAVKSGRYALASKVVREGLRLVEEREAKLRDMRSFAFKGYVIFFRYENDRFEVVNVFEGHRDIIAYFRDDEG